MRSMFWDWANSHIIGVSIVFMAINIGLIFLPAPLDAAYWVFAAFEWVALFSIIWSRRWRLFHKLFKTPWWDEYWYRYGKITWKMMRWIQKERKAARQRERVLFDQLWEKHDEPSKQ